MLHLRSTAMRLNNDRNTRTTLTEFMVLSCRRFIVRVYLLGRMTDSSPDTKATNLSHESACRLLSCNHRQHLFLLRLNAGTLSHRVDWADRLRTASKQCDIWYVLFMITCVNWSRTLCCDRYDLASPTRELLVKSVSLQAGTICVLFYVCGLLVSLIMIPLDERIALLDSSAVNNVTVWIHARVYHSSL